MGPIYCLDPSAILSASFIFIASVGSVSITESQEGRVIPAMTTLLENPPIIHLGILNQQQKSNMYAVGFMDEQLIPPYPAEVLAEQDNPYPINTENVKTFVRLVPFQLERSSIHRYTESFINTFTDTVWNNSHVDLARHKREALHTKIAGETQTNLNIMQNTTLSPVSTISDVDSSTYTVSEMSTLDNMYLCDHPPKTFSPDFLGFSWESCLHYERKWIPSFRDTLDICNSVYSLTETKAKAFNIGIFQSQVGALKVIAQEDYVRVCLPLFRRFNKCEERDFLTICWEDRVVFFHSSICPRFSNDIFSASFLLDNNTECFHEFCKGQQSVVDSEIGDLLFRLTNTIHSQSAPSCGYMTMSLNHIYREYNGTLYLFLNNHWPCCYPLYMVIWAGLPEAHGLNGAWSYMPAACQAGEMLLIVWVGCVMVAGIGGNMLVLVVMFSGGHRGQESSMLRTSLAFSDLLTATFVIVPSFVYHLRPFLFPPTYFKVTPDMELTADPVNVTSEIHVTNGFSRQSGFPVFQSVLFHTTSTASLLMLLVLSVERFIITGRYLRYRDYFSYCRTMLAIVSTWITSLVNALWFAAHDDGGLSAQWLTFEKLPTGASGHGPGGVRDIIYHGQIGLFLMLGISVVTFSLLAIRNFVKEQLHVAKEWKILKMKASKQYSRDNRFVLTTMALMLVLFLTSTIPLATNIIFNSIQYKFHQHPLFSHFAWWLFMAGSAWNPWVYNFRSRQFKEDLINFHHQKLRIWWRRWFRSEELQPMCSTSFSSASSSFAAEFKAK